MNPDTDKVMDKESADKLFKEMMMGGDKQMTAYAQEFIDFLDNHPRESMLVLAISKSVFENFLEDVEIQRSNPYLTGGDEAMIHKHRYVMVNIGAFFYAMKKRDGEGTYDVKK